MTGPRGGLPQLTWIPEVGGFCEDKTWRLVGTAVCAAAAVWSESAKWTRGECKQQWSLTLWDSESELLCLVGKKKWDVLLSSRPRPPLEFQHMRVFQNILNIYWVGRWKKPPIKIKQPQLQPYLITEGWDNGLVDHDGVVSEGAKGCQHIKLTYFRLSETSVDSRRGVKVIRLKLKWHLSVRTKQPCRRLPHMNSWGSYEMEWRNERSF